MKICAKEARRLKSKIEFRRLMEKMKKRFWTSWRSTKSTDIWRSGGGFGRRICKVGKGAQVENLLFYWFFCASVDDARFILLNNTLQAWDPPTFQRILRFNFSYETDFWANSFVAQKSSEMSPLSGSTVWSKKKWHDSSCEYFCQFLFKWKNISGENSEES